MPKGGKKFRDQVRQQKEQEELGLKNLLVKNKNQIIVNEETGEETIKYSNEKYAVVSRNNGSKRYECFAEEEPGKPFTKHKVRKMRRLDHKRHRQKIVVNDVVLIYSDHGDKPDTDGFYGGEIFHKYSEREIVELISRGEISDNLWNQNSTDKGTVDDFNPFYFENEEVKTKEELKKEKSKEGEPYFNYDFNSDEETTTPNAVETGEIDETPSDMKIDLDDI